MASEKNRMKFTIITVCYNAQNDIEKTMKSVLGQTYKDFQYIIKDGNSTDFTMQVIQKTVKQDPRVMIMSGKDAGIYDAMNIALEEAEGEYIFFLNAGDVFHDADVLKQIAFFTNEHKLDVVYGDIILKNNLRSWKKKYGRAYRHGFIYLLGVCICHQAMFAKSDLFENKLFDTKYKVCADREWQLYYLKKRASFKPVNFIISDVLVDGFSLRNVELLEKETEECLKRHYPKRAWIYICLNKCKKNVFVKKILDAIRH